MPPQYHLNTCLPLFLGDLPENGKLMMMPGSWLKIGFHGDRGASKQTLIIPFKDGDDVKYFVVRGVSGGDRRVTGCDMIRIMGWDQLIEYLGISGRSYGTQCYSS
jgi:hypothetical protein